MSTCPDFARAAPGPPAEGVEKGGCLEVRDLRVHYVEDGETFLALDQVNFRLCASEFICLLGPSGAGKTTLLRTIAGLIPPSGGEILRPDTRHGSISLVFQDANLMPWRSALDNVSLPLEVQGVPREEASQRAREWMRLTGLQGFEDAWPRELSGGMAQRVALARALIQQPGLLLMDEPFGALDALTRELMAAELLRIWQMHRTSVLMVTHSISEALILADRVLVFSPRPGRVVLDLPVTFPRPRDESVRYTPEFGRLARLLRQAIG